MQITINIPDNLTDKFRDKLGHLSEKVMNKLALEAFLEGLINFNEFRQMLSFQDENAFKAFLSANFPLHSGGLLNLAGSCADIDFTIDEEGIYDHKNDETILNWPIQ